VEHESVKGDVNEPRAQVFRSEPQSVPAVVSGGPLRAKPGPLRLDPGARLL